MPGDEHLLLGNESRGNALTSWFSQGPDSPANILFIKLCFTECTLAEAQIFLSPVSQKEMSQRSYPPRRKLSEFPLHLVLPEKGAAAQSWVLVMLLPCTVQWGEFTCVHWSSRKHSCCNSGALHLLTNSPALPSSPWQPPFFSWCLGNSHLSSLRVFIFLLN